MLLNVAVPVALTLVDAVTDREAVFDAVVVAEKESEAVTDIEGDIDIEDEGE